MTVVVRVQLYIRGPRDTVRRLTCDRNDLANVLTTYLVGISRPFWNVVASGGTPRASPTQVIVAVFTNSSNAIPMIGSAFQSGARFLIRVGKHLRVDERPTKDITGSTILSMDGFTAIERVAGGNGQRCLESLV